MHDKILSVVTFFYLFLCIMHILYFVLRKEKIVSFIWIALWINLGLHALGLALRWTESYRLGMGHAPFSNMYESLIFYAWSLSLLMVLFRKRIAYPAITGIMCAIALILMGYASISTDVERGIQPLVPALRSNWLHIHVITCFLAYAAFTLSFVCSFIYLVGQKWNIIPVKTLEELNYKCIIIGFSMLTSGILTGAVWAQYAWGSYWSWDPKEIWSLITWIVYAAFLHIKRMAGWRGRAAAILAVIGFMTVVFNYFFVNIILPGMHSYAI